MSLLLLCLLTAMLARSLCLNRGHRHYSCMARVTREAYMPVAAPLRRGSARQLHSINGELGTFRDLLVYKHGTADSYDYYLLENSDVFKAALHLYACFDSADVASSATLGMSDVGKRVYAFFYGVYSTIKRVDTLFGYMVGFISRGGRRLHSAGDMCLSPDPESIVIVATPRGSSDFAGLVELTLERADGRRGTAYSFQSAFIAPPLRPATSVEYYISNLSVSKEHRRVGLGRNLVVLAEHIVRDRFGRKAVHLHVERSNTAAERLYLAEGYRLSDVLPEAERVKEGLEHVGYFTKEL